MQLGEPFMFCSRNSSRKRTNKSSRYHVLQAMILQTLSSVSLSHTSHHLSPSSVAIYLFLWIWTGLVNKLWIN